MEPAPFRFRWDGERMIPLVSSDVHGRFEPGRVYVLGVIDQKSHRATKHYFACIKSAWDSAPEEIAKLFPTPDALRKYALIKAGHAVCRIIPLSSEDQALKVAAMAQSLNSMAIVTVEGRTVCVYTAKSQDGESMTPEEFRDSKRSVLEICAEMVGVSVDELSSNAGASA